MAKREEVQGKIKNNSRKIISNYFRENYDLYSFSTEKNILVLIFDAFPANMLDELLDKKPKIQKGLDGFICYRNNVSTGNFTLNSVNAMVAGPRYTLSKINERADTPLMQLVSKNWANLFNAVGDYGFDISGSPMHVNFEQFHSYLKRPVHPFQGKISGVKNFNSPFSSSFLFNLTLFKISPTFLKKRIYNGGSWHMTKTVNDRYGDVRAIHITEQSSTESDL